VGTVLTGFGDGSMRGADPSAIALFDFPGFALIAAITRKLFAMTMTPQPQPASLPHAEQQSSPLSNLDRGAISTFDIESLESVMVEKIRISGPTLKLLKLLLENPKEGRSGAEISKITKLGSGTMYPLLQRLEIAGWIVGDWEDVDPSEVGRPKRRLYKLTRSGQNAAIKELAQYQTSAPGAFAWT
jgi:PadR family transcriptional regulator PadR